MTVLILGLVLFLGMHLVSTRRALRADLVARFGAKGFKGLYSLASLAGLVLVVYGFGQYRAGGYVEVWTPPRALAHAALLLVLPALVLFFTNQRPGSWIRAKVRHPLLLGVKLWAAAHLLANGDLGSIVLFGSFLAWAGYARSTMDAREAAEGAPDRAVKHFGADDRRAVIVGCIVYFAIVRWLHEWLIGVPVLG